MLIEALHVQGDVDQMAKQGVVDQMAKQSIDAKEALSPAPAGSEDVMKTYTGMAVQQPGEAFKVWEYKAGPLAPNDVEIKVRINSVALCHMACISTRRQERVEQGCTSKGDSIALCMRFAGCLCATTTQRV